jgi:hypothetical protein
LFEDYSFDLNGRLGGLKQSQGSIVEQFARGGKTGEDAGQGSKFDLRFADHAAQTGSQLNLSGLSQIRGYRSETRGFLTPFLDDIQDFGYRVSGLWAVV